MSTNEVDMIFLRKFHLRWFLLLTSWPTLPGWDVTSLSFASFRSNPGSCNSKSLRRLGSSWPLQRVGGCWLVVAQSQQEGMVRLHMIYAHMVEHFSSQTSNKGGGNEFLIFGPKTGWRGNDPDLGWNIHFIHWPEKITGAFTAQNSSQLEHFPFPREVNSELAPISTNSPKWDYRCSISQPTI